MSETGIPTRTRSSYLHRRTTPNVDGGIVKPVTYLPGDRVRSTVDRDLEHTVLNNRSLGTVIEVQPNLLVIEFDGGHQCEVRPCDVSKFIECTVTQIIGKYWWFLEFGSTGLILFYEQEKEQFLKDCNLKPTLEWNQKRLDNICACPLSYYEHARRLDHCPF